MGHASGKEGETDLGITYIDDVPEEFSTVPLGREAFHVVLPKGHPLSARKEVTLVQAAEFAMVSLPRQSVCCMGRQIGRVEPYPCSGSRDPDILRASKVQHAVQHVGSNGHFGRLSPVCLRAQSITDDALPTRYIGLHQSAPVVA